MRRKHQPRGERARPAVTIRIDDEVLARVDAIAETDGTTRSSVIEDLVTRALPRKKRVAHASILD